MRAPRHEPLRSRRRRGPVAWPILAILLAVSMGCDDEMGQLPPVSPDGGGGTGGAVVTGGAGGAAGQDRVCWDAPPAIWSTVEPFDPEQLAGTQAGSPSFGVDGLTLYFVARSSLSAPRRVFRTTRATPREPFTGGELVAGWPTVDQIDHPWVAGDELFLNFDHGSGVFELASAGRDGDGWLAPVSLGATVNGGFASSNPTVTADGLRMVYRYQAEAGELLLRLHEATRATAGAGEPFTDVADVAIPPIPADHHLLCPALSPDGTQLYFSTSYPADISSGLPAGAIQVWHAARGSVDEPWQQAVPVDEFDGGDFHGCVYALRPDGCELIFQHFQVGASGSVEFFTARR